MRNIKLTLEYDGRDFFGFQSQPKKRTVQSELEKAFLKLFRTKTKISSAAGRTDAGVHAKGQVVNFKTDSQIPIVNIHRALNTYLPQDLAVSEVKEVASGFHARFKAKRKTYEYLVWNSKVRAPLKREKSYQFPHALNLKPMKRAAKLLVGKHDFRSFAASCYPERSERSSFVHSSSKRRPQNDTHKNSVRTIYRFSIQKKGNEVRFRVEGDGFLYNMVRAMVGTLLLVGTGKISLPVFQAILNGCDRRHVGPTIPAKGLTLLQVSYE